MEIFKWLLTLPEYFIAVWEWMNTEVFTFNIFIMNQAQQVSVTPISLLSVGGLVILSGLVLSRLLQVILPT